MLAVVLVVQAAVTWALVGLIWTIQLAHYPLLAGIAADRYPRWQRLHMRRITAVVAPLDDRDGRTLAAAAGATARAAPDINAMDLVPVDWLPQVAALIGHHVFGMDPHHVYFRVVPSTDPNATFGMALAHEFCYYFAHGRVDCRKRLIKQGNS